MYYQRIPPTKLLADYVECFWIAESDDLAVITQKIIPDGFPEIIFHYSDPYQINLDNEWLLQDANLVAGQIRNHFFLQNTGTTGVFGIKFKPAAISQLFNLSMELLTGKVVPLASLDALQLNLLATDIQKASTTARRIDVAEMHLETMSKNVGLGNTSVIEAIKLVFAENGNISVSEMCKKLFITERQLQRLFQKYVGLSPKFYCRIIRFNFIFNLLQTQKLSWTDIAYHSGYFDQSHFIRDFKAFSGEDPSKYFFNENTMANFFLKK